MFFYDVRKNVSIWVNGDFNNYHIFWKNVLVNYNLFTHETLRSSVWEHVSVRTIKNWNLEMFVFEERWKPDYPDKNLSEQGREPTSNSTPAVDAAIWILTTLVGGECSHHRAIPCFPVRKGLAWVSGVSGWKGERWKRKRERAEGEKRLTQMFLLEPSTPTQHDSITCNQNNFLSLLPLPPPPSKISSPLAPWEDLILRLGRVKDTRSNG